MMTQKSGERKQKATAEMAQLLINMEQVADAIEKYLNENDEQTEGLQLSSEIYTIRSQMMSEYEWFDETFEENGKVGLKNVLGEVVVPAAYDGFRERYHYFLAGPVPRVAIKGKKMGLVAGDGSGRELTGMVYDNMAYMAFLPLYKVLKDGKIGFLDLEANMVAPCELDSSFESNGYCLIVEAGGKYGIIDTSIGLYVPPRFDYIEYVDIEQPYTFTLNGVEGIVTEKGDFLSFEEAEEYDGYVVGEFFQEY